MAGLTRVLPKSLCMSYAVNNFYGTGIEIGLDLGRLAILKKIGPVMSNF